MNLRGELWVRAPLDEVFRFFTDPSNLERLSPPWVHFRLETPLPIEMRTGTLLDYRLRIHGVPVRWQSAITSWQPPYRFVDEQRRGPSLRWVHTHRFRSERGGTVVEDDVHFEAPFGVLTGWFVRRDVEKIFAYRLAVLHEIFSAGK
jgi:ligand-binding SRPBCC domain-containing protein